MSQAKRPPSYVFLGAMVAAALYGCYRLFTPFLSAIAWALAIAVVGAPLHRALSSKVKNPHLAAGISVTVIACIVIFPAWIASQQIVSQATNAIGYWIEHEPWKNVPTDFPFRDYFDVRGSLQHVAAQIPGILKTSVDALTQLPIAGFCLFFFFRDQKLMVDYLRTWLPLSGEEFDQITSRISDILYATIWGRLLLATIQGALGGMMFWWLGLPTPLLWFMVMSVLALLPFLGAALVWFPAAAYLLWSGSVVQGIVLLAWGGLVVSSIDNVLYPLLVGPRMQLHPLMTFFGVIGGVAWFGASGIILGPVILATTAALLEVWNHRMQPKDSSDIGLGEPLEPGEPEKPELTESPRTDGSSSEEVSRE